MTLVGGAGGGTFFTVSREADTLAVAGAGFFVVTGFCVVVVGFGAGGLGV